MRSCINTIILTNKYSKLYHKITSNPKQRITEGYTEIHHIIPQSLGGSNERENLVELTAREHFICHWLLVKMTEGEDKGKMLYALQGMKAENKFQQRYHTKITARVYEKYRLEHAENHSKRMKGRPAWNKGRKLEGQKLQEHIERARNRHIDPAKQAEGQRKRIEKILGRKDNEEAKLKKSLALKGKPKGPMSDEEKLKRSLTQKGVPKVKTHGANVANAVKGNISINKDGFEKKVKKEILQEYLNDGWQLGGRKRKIA